MPYVIVGKCVHKKNEDGSTGETVKCHESEEKAKAHMRALYANVKDSEIAEMSLVVTKASFDKSEPDPNKKRRIQMVNSDVSPDLYQESMSMELFKDFSDRIANNTPIPEMFKSVICEDGVWCGGMPYISIAHYRAGKGGKNVPGTVESVYVDGKQLKSKAYLNDTPLGRKLFDTLCEDLEKFRSGTLEKPVRVSIGFLDLEHVHEVNGKSVVFTRKALGQKCALCEKGEGGKIYKKGHLVHLAATRVPVNPRTEMGLEEKSMDEITTKREDAASIIGEDLAKDLEEKSAVSDVLVVKSEAPEQDDLKVELATVKSTLDEVLKSLEKLQEAKSPVVEESMDEKEVIAKADEPEKKDDKVEEKKEVAQEKSALDVRFDELKSVIASAKSPDELQAAYNALGQEVQKAYVAPPPNANDIAEIVKSAVEAAVAPLKMQLATLQAQGQVQKSTQMNPVTRALTLTPAELTQRSTTPKRQLTQIEQIALRSTGAL
jgi:hypothetical protein